MAWIISLMQIIIKSNNAYLRYSVHRLFLILASFPSSFMFPSLHSINTIRIMQIFIPLWHTYLWYPCIDSFLFEDHFYCQSLRLSYPAHRRNTQFYRLVLKMFMPATKPCVIITWIISIMQIINKSSNTHLWCSGRRLFFFISVSFP